MGIPARTEVRSLLPRARCGSAVVRQIGDGEDHLVRQLFRDTLVLGGPTQLREPTLRAYERLCLGWYLTSGRREVRLVAVDDEVCGYVLVCVDQPSHDRWARRAAARWLVDGGLAAVRAPAASADRRFIRLRLWDGWRAWRHGPPVPAGAHAHMNLRVGVRGGRLAIELLAHIDRIVADAGHHGWFGEMNFDQHAPVRALRAAGAEIVHWMPNATLSWQAGRPVRRATVVRDLRRGTG